MTTLQSLAAIGSQMMDVVLPIAATALAGLLARKLNLDAKGAQAEQLQRIAETLAQAARQGAGIAYGMLASQGAATNDQPATNVALASGVTQALALYPKAVAAAQLTPEAMGKLVAAEFGNLLAADPSVTVAPPAA